jgi:hypothetical protein
MVVVPEVQQQVQVPFGMPGALGQVIQDEDMLY